MKKTVVACTFVVALWGCASQPDGGSVAVQPALANPADAMVVVYRPQTLDHFGRSPAVDINGKTACDLANGNWFAREVGPGRMLVSTSLWDWPGTSKTNFAADAGKTYYVRISPDYSKRIAGILGGGPIGVAIANHFSDRSGPFLVDVIAADQAKAEIGPLQQAHCS